MDAEYEARMKRIEEKHEALAQSLELLHHEVMQQTRNIDQLTVESVANQQLIVQVMTAMQELIGIVTAHERRIQAIEGQ